MKKFACSFLITLLFQAILLANVPAPFFGGEAGFEPLGLENFDSVSEKISIDLTLLENYSEYGQDNAVKIENIFEIENKQAEKTIEIALPFGQVYEIYLDDVNLSLKWQSNNALKSVWKTPNETFWTDGKKLSYRANNSQPQSVQIKIPAGKHTFKIKQNLAPSSNVTGILTKYWQFSFNFLPPENRKNIVKTEYEIKTPANWQSVVMPETAGENGVWKGSVGSGTMPNALLITTKMPVPSNYHKMQTFSDIFAGFALIGFPLIGLLLCWFVFAKSKFWWLWGIGFTLIWAALSFAGVYASNFAAENTIPEVQQINYGYDALGMAILSFLTGCAAFVLGFPLWLLVWFLAKKIRKIS